MRSRKNPGDLKKRERARANGNFRSQASLHIADLLTHAQLRITVGRNLLHGAESAHRSSGIHLIACVDPNVGQVN
jgi:hypothetical protein